MDETILLLRLLQKAVTAEDEIDVDSSEFRSEFNSLDTAVHTDKDGSVLPNEEIEARCFVELEFRRSAPLIVTEEQISTLLDMMSFFLLFDKPCVDEDGKKDELRQIIRTQDIMNLLVQLIDVLLAGNWKPECEAWVKANVSKLKSLRTDSTMLHIAMPRLRYSCPWPKEPIVRLLVEHGKMDVNAENRHNQTPLHLLSLKAQDAPTEDMVKVAEVLIDNGAHMDALDNSGKEASHAFSRRFPKWSFKFNLKCLAARALVQHGVQYESIAPKTQLSFIQSHKQRGNYQ